MAARLAALLLAVLAAGFGAPAAPPADEERWRFGGSFAHGYTREDMLAVCSIVDPDGPCEMLQSEPPLYGGMGNSRAACEDLRARVLALPRVADVRPCERMG